jgi:hypothetical protein
MKTKWIPPLVLFAIMALQFINVKPYYNWDMIAYVAVAYSYFEDDIVVVHQKTYSAIDSQVSDKTFDWLTIADGQTNKSLYRQGVFSNPEYLRQAMPFYSVKPLYPLLLAGFIMMDINPVFASTLISKAFYAMTMLLCFVWLLRYLGGVESAVTVALLFSVPLVSAMARFSTPDAMSTFFVLLCLYISLELRRPRLALFCLALVVAVRPDVMLFAVLLALFMSIAQRTMGLRLLFLASISVVMYLLVTRLNDGYSWNVLFANTYRGGLLEPASYESELSLINYLSIYWGFFKNTLFNTQFSIYLLLISMATAFSIKFSRYEEAAVSGACLLYMGGHWLVHPMDKERTLLFTFILAIILIIRLLASVATLPAPSLGSKSPDDKH